MGHRILHLAKTTRSSRDARARRDYKLASREQRGYRNNFRFPISSLLTLKLSLLYKTRVAMRFPAKITSSCIWVAIPVD